jgi:hypothetical protein
VRRLPASAARLDASTAWLARFPGHPLEAELRALRAADDAACVLAWLRHDSGSDTLGVFLADDVAVTLGRDATVRRWVLSPGAPEQGGSSGRERWREDARVKLPAAGTALARGPDRARVVVGCVDGSAHELLGPQTRTLRRFGQGGSRVDHLALDPRGAFALACSRELDTVAVLNLTDGLALTLGPGDAPANAAVVTRAGRVIVAYGAEVQESRGGQGVRAFDLSTLAVCWSLPTRSRCRSLALSPDERLVAVGDALGNVLVLPIDGPAAGAPRTLTPDGPGGMTVVGVGFAVMGLAFSPDGRRLYGVSSTTAEGVGGLRAWDTSTWREARPAVQLVEPVSLDISRDGRRLLVGTNGRRVEVWSTAE